MGTITTGDRDTPVVVVKQIFSELQPHGREAEADKPHLNRDAHTHSLPVSVSPRCFPPGRNEIKKQKERERERETWSRAQQRINFNFFKTKTKT